MHEYSSSSIQLTYCIRLALRRMSTDAEVEAPFDKAVERIVDKVVERVKPFIQETVEKALNNFREDFREELAARYGPTFKSAIITTLTLKYNSLQPKRAVSKGIQRGGRRHDPPFVPGPPHT